MSGSKEERDMEELELEDGLDFDFEEGLEEGKAEETNIEGLQWLNVAEIKVLEGVNPRESLNEKNVVSLQEIDADDLLPLIVAYHDGGYINIDGHHRLESRIRNKEGKVKAFVEKIDNMEEIIKKAFTTNVNHGIRLTIEEVRKFTKKMIESKNLDAKGLLALNLESLNREYQIPKGTVQATVTQLTLTKIIEEKNPELIEVFEKMPVKILSKLRILTTKSDEETVLKFVVNFKEFLKAATWYDQKTISTMVELFMEGKIEDLAGYNEITEEATRNEKLLTLTPEEKKDIEEARKESEEFVEDNVEEEDPENIFGGDEETEEVKMTFEIHKLAKNIFEETKNKRKSIEKILEKTNVKKDEAKNTIEEIDKTIKEYMEMKKLFEKLI